MSSTATEIPSTMKAVVINELGGPECLKLINNHPTPQLKPGHAIIQNQYAGLNFIDTYFRKGLYKAALPFVPGQEGGGTILAISSDDTNNDSTFQVGDVVVYGTLGAYAQYTLVPVTQLVKVPQNVSLDIAVSCYTQGLTAHYLTTSVHCGMLQTNDWCLIYSVGSGTCQWAAQMAKIQGYKVIGTCSQSKAAAVMQVGACDELIVLKEVEGGMSYSDYGSVDIVGKVMDITNQKGVKCILDGVGKSTVDISLGCLAQRGLYVSFGNASGAVPAFPVLRLNAKSAFVTRPKLKDYVRDEEELMGRWGDIMEWISGGMLKVSVDCVFDLEDVKEGHVYLESGKSKGKILYKI